MATVLLTGKKQDADSTMTTSNATPTTTTDLNLIEEELNQSEVTLSESTTAGTNNVMCTWVLVLMWKLQVDICLKLGIRFIGEDITERENSSILSLMLIMLHASINDLRIHLLFIDSLYRKFINMINYF